jgi:transcriptional regulator with XRE-family HTH domain
MISYCFQLSWICRINGPRGLWTKVTTIQRNQGIRCIVATISLKTKRPQKSAYQAELKTLGDHLRRTRLDRRLTQGDKASILLVDTDAVMTWEMNRHQPTAKFAKPIISFLRYLPFTFEGQSLGRQLYYARLITGHTQKQVAELMGCDASNLRCIELDQTNPLTRTYEKIQD